MANSEHFTIPEHTSSSGVITLPSFGAQTIRTADGAIEPIADGLPIERSAPLRGRIGRRRERVPTVVIDKGALFRAGLCHILTGSRFRVAAEYGRLADVPLDLLGHKRGVVIVSLDHNPTAVLSWVSMLIERNENLCVLALGDRLDPELLVATFDSGAGGYLLRDEIGPDAVLKSLELVLVGGVVVPQGFTILLRDAVPQPLIVPMPAPPSAIVQAHRQVEIAPSAAENIVIEMKITPDPHLARLSDREQLILVHLTQGASNKHIARELNIAEATVKAHIKSLLRKIRVSNRTQAAMWAISHVRTSERTAPAAQV
jgi:two-component system, NarL family, nitrate/nitrite response regulator NarL